MRACLGRCIYKNCGRSRRLNPGVHMFSFPVKNKGRCKQWISNSGCATILQTLSPSQLKLQVVCQDHFEPSAFINQLKHRLVHDAIPKPYDDIVKNEYSNTEIPLFEQVFLVAEPFEESAPPTTLHEDKPLLLNRTENTKTYLRKT